jgi:DNA helicase HerA-like ATPase
MPITLHISRELSLPTEAVSETFAIPAKRGAGKTYTAAVMVEELLKVGLHIIVVDPVGVWWGLRAAANGKRESLPIVVLGGEHGEIPLDVGAGELIANLVVEEGLSVVLDLSLFRKSEQTRFMTDFAEQLYHKN